MKPEIKFIQVNQVPIKILVYDDDDGGGGNEFDCHTKFNKQRLIMMITGLVIQMDVSDFYSH